ncbi:hypothetical protein [Pengzhenrongella phosphoraccumulans]|uniref:hypothetical protein n=1 Tax=Pengzhenrongella phosphoraccumulans TaxID=3114394 RepID=UPI00389115FD
MRNLLFLLLIGLVVYAAISLLLRVRSGPAGPSRASGPPRTGWRPVKPSGPVAPDDDPEFLWRLDQQQRQADRDAHRENDAHRETNDDDGTAADPREPTP